MRAVSTLPDVVLFLLLVSGAVGTLALVPTPAPTDGTAEGTARTLSATTVAVEDDAGRTVHGTPTGLLAAAAVDGARLDGWRLLHDDPVASGHADALLTPAVSDGRVRVEAVWRPYPNASLVGRVAVGPRPPHAATVDAAVVTVPTGLPGEAAARRAARRSGFDGVAGLLARSVVSRAFPPGGTRAALYDSRLRADAAVRYRHTARAVGSDADLSVPLGAANATAANRLVSEALAGRIEADLRDRFDTPEAAASAVAADRVRVTVRTWHGGSRAGWSR
ncbi:DUF7284 family protein [Halomarina litorea]|uniref:DUF7284 family protein n=1 Tax=Halomarina litorea TaxID=2961595 RepID=UPI0020C3CB46|nr:hypothetical protein [Halomarina sp. BCD28]